MPNKQNSSNYANEKCDTCGLNNHDTNNCLKKRNNNNIKCQVCGVPGHSAPNCIELNENKKTLLNMQSR